MSRRMAFRIPEKRYKQVKKILKEKDKDFDDFIDKVIDLYLSEEINPKEAEKDWGTWMEKKK